MKIELNDSIVVLEALQQGRGLQPVREQIGATRTSKICSFLKSHKCIDKSGQSYVINPKGTRLHAALAEVHNILNS